MKSRRSGFLILLPVLAAVLLVGSGGKSLLPEFMVGRRSDKIKATDVIWDFFQKHLLLRANMI